MRFWGNSEKTVKEALAKEALREETDKEARELLKDIVKKEGRPFVPPKEQITNLDTFLKRTEQLKTEIGTCQAAIISLAEYIESLSDPKTEWRIEKNSVSANSFWFYSNQNAKIDAEVRKIIVSYWKSQIIYYKELKHTCEDELDWLERKMGLNGLAQGLQNYNFNPNENHA